jgi:hypothetical protein
MVRSAKRVSNHEAPIVASSFETLAAQVPQNEEIECSLADAIHRTAGFVTGPVIAADSLDSTRYRSSWPAASSTG